MASHLNNITDAAAQMSDEDFDALYGETAFILEGVTADGGVIELCPLGQSKSLTKENAH